MVTRRRFVQAALLAPSIMPTLASRGFAAEGDDYPSGVIHAICSYSVGSGADIRVRFYSKKLAELTGKTVVVENKPGAFGNIGTEFVTKAKPDGHTIFITAGGSTLAAPPALFKKLNFDPLNDLEHITTLSTSAFVLCVDGRGPFKTVADLTANLKERGEAASYGSVANPGLVSSEIYKANFGLKTVEVKYKDQRSMVNDLQGGHISFFHLDVNGAGGLIKDGRLRALATTSANRLSSWPDIPGAQEAGIPGLDIQTWWSVHVPAKTPKAICDKLEGWFNTIVLDPETTKFNQLTGADPMPGTSASLKALLVKETKAWADYVKLAKIEPQ